MYPALGLCGPDEAHKMVERGDNTVGVSDGHPRITHDSRLLSSMVENTLLTLLEGWRPKVIRWALQALACISTSWVGYILDSFFSYRTPNLIVPFTLLVQLRNCGYLERSIHMFFNNSNIHYHTQ